MSNIQAVLPPSGRDLRLDLFRGIANWAIFLDHIPHNIVAWVTTRNYGFSDAADLFVFISGYTASFVYAKVMLERGFLIGAAKYSAIEATSVRSGLRSMHHSANGNIAISTM